MSSNRQRLLPTIAAIAAILKERYHRDVAADVIEYLSQLVERELVRVE